MEQILVKCQNIIRNNDGVISFDAFEEISKILFSLMKSGKMLNISELKIEFSKIDHFFSDKKINLKDSTITEVLNELNKIENIFDKDIKGRVYEIFLGRVFQSELGQFLTPKKIVKFIVKFISLIYDQGDGIKILDPACGSGGFLIEIIKYFKNCELYGFDVNKRILDIGRRNLFIHDQSIENLILHSFVDSNIEENSIDIVLTNPPFGVKESQMNILLKYELSKGKKQIVLENIFIEKIIKILKPGGVCGIVLPDGLLNNPSSKDVRKLLFDNVDIIASIDLPESSFKSSGTGCETGILFFRKKQENSKVNNILFAKPEHIGYETKSKFANSINKNDLPDIIESYKNSTNSILNVFLKNTLKNGERLDGKYYVSKNNLDTNNTLKISDLVIKSGENNIDTNNLKYIQFSDLNEDISEILTYTEYDNIDELPNRAKIKVKYGDIVCAGMKQSSKKISVIKKEYDGYLVSNGFVVIRPKSNKIEDSFFISYLLRSDFCQEQIKSKTTGTIMPTISDDDFLEIYIPEINDPELTDKILKLKNTFEEYKKDNKTIIEEISKKRGL